MSTHPPLPDALADYLALRRVLGCKLANAARLLGQFVDYLHSHGVDTPPPTTRWPGRPYPHTRPPPGGRSG